MVEITQHTMVCKPRRDWWNIGWHVQWSRPSRARYRTMIGGEAEGGRKIFWEPTITLGNILTLAMMIIAGLVPFFDIKSDLRLAQVQVAEQGRAIAGIQELISARSGTRYDRPDAVRDFDLRDKRLDDQEHRIQLLELAIARTGK